MITLSSNMRNLDGDDSRSLTIDDSKDTLAHVLDTSPEPSATKTAATTPKVASDVPVQAPAHRATATPAIQSSETFSTPRVLAQSKPRNLYLVAAFSSLGGLLFGLDTGEKLP